MTSVSGNLIDLPQAISGESRLTHGSKSNEDVSVIYVGYLVPPLKSLLESRDFNVTAVAIEPWRIRSQDMIGFLGEWRDAPQLVRLDQGSDLDVQLSRLATGVQVGIIAGFGHILKASLTAPRLGWMNIHPGSIPEFRGNRPIELQIQTRQPGVTVTVHDVVPKVDAGPIRFMVGQRMGHDFKYSEALSLAMNLVAPEMPQLVREKVAGVQGIEVSPETASTELPTLSLKELKISAGQSVDDAITLHRITEGPVTTTYKGNRASLVGIHSPKTFTKYCPSSSGAEYKDLLLDLHEEFESPSIAIMQPHFLPWLGYLDMMDQVDLFVFLDDVQLSRQSHQTRNLLRHRSGQVQWISLPHRQEQGIKQTLSDTQIASASVFKRKITGFLRHEYRSSSLLEELCQMIDETIQDGSSVADVNIEITLFLAQQFGIKTPTIRSSALSARLGRVERINGILNHTCAATYLAAPGSRLYMDDAGRSAFEVRNIRFHQFESPSGRVQVPGTLNFRFPSAVHDLLASPLEPREQLICGRRRSYPWNTLPKTSSIDGAPSSTR